MGSNPKAEEFKFPLDLGAPAGSLEGRSPPIDNGLDVPDPSRYYAPEFMQKEWERLWPNVWLLAAVTADIRTGSPSIVSWLLSPILTTVKQAAREQ